jgi:hypothetical protein
MGEVNGSTVAKMPTGRRIFRALFFAAESGTLVAWVICTGADVEMYYRAILMDRFKPFAAFALLCLFLLPIASFYLRRTDPRLARIGFATFFGILALLAVFQLF